MRHRRDAGDNEPIFIKHRDYDYEYNGSTVDVGGYMNAGTLNNNFRLAAEKLGHTESGKQNQLERISTPSSVPKATLEMLFNSENISQLPTI